MPECTNLIKSKEKESARKSIVKSHLSTASISSKDVIFPFLSVLISNFNYIGNRSIIKKAQQLFQLWREGTRMLLL